MAAHENLGAQFDISYDTFDAGGSKPLHRLQARNATGFTVGSMLWDSRQIRGLNVIPEAQRRGVATSLWNKGHQLAAETKGIPQPKHSSDRTIEGSAWARSVGGRLPRRSGD